MVPHIPSYIQRKLPCTSLFSHMPTLSTPLRLLYKNRFLHAWATVHAVGYKQDASKIPECRLMETESEINRRALLASSVESRARPWVASFNSTVSHKTWLVKVEIIMASMMISRQYEGI